MSNRAYHLRRKYGITLEQYQQLFEEQEGKCPICLKPAKGVLHVDHDHVTGVIRGLLCNWCNLRFIGRHRNADYFERAATYLRKPTEWIVPKKKRRRRKRVRRKRR